MVEVRFHGRGGQGVVTAAEILAAALVAQGKHVAAFPMFGFERRGAPVMAFLRFDDRPVREKTQIYNPDCLVIADPLFRNYPAVYQGLKPGGIAVVNSPTPMADRPHEAVSLLGAVDATGIALKEMGIPATNTCMLGALAATTGWLPLEPLLEVLEDYFSGEWLRRNRNCLERGFAEVKVVRFG